MSAQGRNFLQYWKPKEAKKALARRADTDEPLRVIGGSQLRKMRPGDVVWIVTQGSSGGLDLCGRLVVDGVFSHTDVEKRNHYSPEYDADFYAFSRDDLAEYVERTDITTLAPALKFIPKASLTIRSGRISPQQLQSIRQLDGASVGLLRDARGTQAIPISRGGLEVPKVRDISKTPPKRGEDSDMPADPEVRLQALDRRNKAHHRILRAIADRAEASGLECNCSQYADALCDGGIFEVKTIEDDPEPQVRAAVGQLYHYLFIHRNLKGFENADLYAVFDRPISSSLATFLRRRARIGVITLVGNRFVSDQTTMSRLRWLFQ